jgi:Uma2 family endonuclease
MSHELDESTGTNALDAESSLPVEEQDRKGCELIDGVWVPKHPEEIPPYEDRPGREFVNGEWVEKGMSNVAGVVESRLHFAFQAHLRANPSGFVFSDSAMYLLFPKQSKQVRKPDISFIRFGRLPDDEVPDKSIEVAPDVAVEVISPTDIAEEVEKKLDEYLRAGVRLVWVVYLPTRNVWAYKPDGTAKLYRSSDTLSGEDVLPGLAVPVAELFEGV